MNKRLTLAAVAVVGVVGIAAWSVAQSPGDKSQTKPPSGTTSGTSGSGKSLNDILDGGSKPSSTKSGSSTSSAPRLSPSSSAPSARPSSSLFPSNTTTSGDRSPLTTSRGLPEVDSSSSPSRSGLSSRSDPSPGSSLSDGKSIRIDHALVTSLDPIKLPARSAGAIRSISVKKGIEVKAEEILGQLDDRDAQTKKKIAELERDAARIQAESEAQIKAAKDGAKVTEENYKANEKLRNDRPGSLSDFDFRRSWFEWQRALAQIAVAEVEKAVAEATQLAKEGQIDGAMNEIERLKIVAPIDGFVNDVYKHVGEWCQPGDPILEIIRMDRVEIEGFVFAAEASPAKVLNKPVDVIVQVAGGETYKASGIITFASPVLEGSGRIRQFRVSTEIDNKKEGNDWVIQVGTEAEMVIQLEPPAPKPAAASGSGLPAGTKNKGPLPGAKAGSYRPVIPDSAPKADATKSGAKTEAKTGAKLEPKPADKTEVKSKAGTTKPDAGTTDEPKANAAGKTDSSKAAPSKSEKSDDSATDGSKPAADGSKGSKSSEPSDASPPAKKGEKESAKSSKIRV